MEQKNPDDAKKPSVRHDGPPQPGDSDTVPPGLPPKLAEEVTGDLRHPPGGHTDRLRRDGPESGRS